MTVPPRICRRICPSASYVFAAGAILNLDAHLSFRFMEMISGAWLLHMKDRFLSKVTATAYTFVEILAVAKWFQTSESDVAKASRAL